MDGFEPSGRRGELLASSVQRDLLDSLRHVSDATAGSEIALTLEPALVSLSRGVRASPQAFGQYFEMAEALFADDEKRALNAAVDLVACLPCKPGFEVVARGSSAARALDNILDRRMGEEARRFADVDDHLMLGFRERLQQGMNLLEQGAPGLHAEMMAILSTVLVAQAPQGALREFDGASHYQFWGLLLINPRHHPTRLAMAEVLAHESGHLVLFAMTRDEPLVYNADDELFSSPLRVDPRPMDGIFHATYVSARMAWTMNQLANSGRLTPQERDEAIVAEHQDRANFERGIATVQAHGQLSPLGREVMASAYAWMTLAR